MTGRDSRIDAIAASDLSSAAILDHIEDEIVCKARGCRGKVGLGMARKGDTSAFFGGLA